MTVITKVVDLSVKRRQTKSLSSRKASGARFRRDLLKPPLLILRMLNSSFSVSLKKLSISRCKPILPILKMLIIKRPKGSRRFLVKALSWPYV
jgi:hypothetical protein